MPAEALSGCGVMQAGPQRSGATGGWMGQSSGSAARPDGLNLLLNQWRERQGEAGKLLGL